MVKHLQSIHGVGNSKSKPAQKSLAEVPKHMVKIQEPTCRRSFAKVLLQKNTEPLTMETRTTTKLLKKPESLTEKKQSAPAMFSALRIGAD